MFRQSLQGVRLMQVPRCYLGKHVPPAPAGSRASEPHADIGLYSLLDLQERFQPERGRCSATAALLQSRRLATCSARAYNVARCKTACSSGPFGVNKQTVQPAGTDPLTICSSRACKVSRCKGGAAAEPAVMTCRNGLDELGRCSALTGVAMLPGACGTESEDMAFWRRSNRSL